MMKRTDQNEELGAIVCCHVAKGFPILGAVRAAPQDPADSGWQFMCYSGQEESIEDAQIWSIKQVLEREQSLRSLVGSKVGTRVVRDSVSSDWSVQEGADD
jgi:hypothetical protein